MYVVVDKWQAKAIDGCTMSVVDVGQWMNTG